MERDVEKKKSLVNHITTNKVDHITNKIRTEKEGYTNNNLTWYQ